MMHSGIQKNLAVWLTSKERRNSGYMAAPYAFLIQSYGTSYNAFVTASAFRRWLKERGLKLRGNRILGQFINRPLASLEGLEGRHAYHLSNGRYCKAIITEEDGVRVVNFEWTGVYEPWTDEALIEHRKLNKIL